MKNKNNRVFLGKIASIVGIVFNLLLAGGKILMGVLFGAVSVMADGFNNLTDCGSSVISMISFKLSSKPADKEHPFGHERVEYICSMVVAFIILLIAFSVIKESIGKIINGSIMEFSYLIIAVLVGSILIKLGLFFYYRTVSKKINSDILKATSIDCLTDSISTGVVLISTVVFKVFNVNIDGYAGIFVALFIGFSGVSVLKETFSKLVGEVPDKELVEEIKTRILSREGVLGIHDLSVYSYGPNKFFASVHVEVDANVDVLASHELVDDIEKEFLEETNVVLTGHLDPIVVDDEEVNEMRIKMALVVKNINEEFSMHDFRMVKGERHTNILFDVAVPFGTKMTKEEIENLIKLELQKIDEKYRLVLTVENSI
ncbi:MAG: cation transporter [Clostridia bacterium]|nr:cation transporter [Clostridia bacterium]